MLLFSARQPKWLLSSKPKSATRLTVTPSRNLEGRLISLGQFRFPPGDLQKAGIRVIPSLSERSDGRPDVDPCFFDPYPTDLLTMPKDGFVATKFPEHNHDRSQLHGETPVERSRALCHYLRRYLSAYRSRRPDIKFTVFRDSGWCYREDVCPGVLFPVVINFILGSFCNYRL